MLMILKMKGDTPSKYDCRTSDTKLRTRFNIIFIPFENNFTIGFKCFKSFK